MNLILTLLSLLAFTQGFAPSSLPKLNAYSLLASSSTTKLYSETTIGEATSIEPKEAVKLFGRLADKYILLDASAGLCCYSACKDCEYRLPDGGYRMADQSASRPKWIASYDERSFESSGKEHTSKWATDIFTDNAMSVTKDEFVSRLIESKFAPTLGGPYMSASAANIEDKTAAERFFDILVMKGDVDVKQEGEMAITLTRKRMGKRIKELAGGEEGLTWNDFIKALTVEV